MAIAPYVVTYAAAALFVVVVIARLMWWVKMPMHLRWELYPVAHEGKRAEWGGSYLEESEWWKKPRHTDKIAEGRAMAAEILFLVALKEHNPKMWVRSFPFHFGLYMTIAATVVVLGGGVLTALLPDLMQGGLGSLVRLCVTVVGGLGMLFALLGGLGLLQRRLTDPALRDFTTVADLFNLLFFVVAFGLALATLLVVDLDATRVVAFAHRLVTFDLRPMTGTGAELWLPVGATVLLALLMAYIPLTHMSHFVAKYFAYHSIRWNDAPNLAGGPEEETIGKLLGQKISWAAPHIRGGGTKTWVDAAMEKTAEEGESK